MSHVCRPTHTSLHILTPRTPNFKTTGRDLSISYVTTEQILTESDGHENHNFGLTSQRTSFDPRPEKIFLLTQGWRQHQLTWTVTITMSVTQNSQELIAMLLQQHAKYHYSGWVHGAVKIFHRETWKEKSLSHCIVTSYSDLPTDLPVIHTQLNIFTFNCPRNSCHLENLIL